MRPRAGAGESEADDLGHEHVDGLAEHDRLGLDAADAPADDAEAVDHGGVAVGADQRVGIGFHGAVALASEHAAGEVLEVDLVDDAGRRGHDAEVVEALWPHLRNFIALVVALELALAR